MTRTFLLASCLALASIPPAHADGDAGVPATDADATLAQVREHFAKHEYAEAKQLLVSAYAATQRPDLLFALGQVEFNLDNFDQAIAYYTQYLTTNPDQDHAELAQQALGAARARIAAPKPKPLPPPPPPRLEEHRVWRGGYTAMLIGGGAVMIGGGVLLFHGHRAGYDTSGTLRAYGDRIERGRHEQIIGASAVGAGAIVIGAAVIAYAVRRETVLVVAPTVTEHAAALAIVGRW